MSLDNSLKIEDLKKQSAKILNERYELVESQKPKAVVNALNEMADYLKSKQFVVAYNQSKPRGFTANYGDIKIVVISSGDSEAFVGSDYVIDLEYGKKKLSVHLSVNSGIHIESPRGSNSDEIIKDYETRYLPSIKKLSLDELDGSYKLFIYAENKSGKRIEILSNGQAAIDKLFEGV